MILSTTIRNPNDSITRKTLQITTTTSKNADKVTVINILEAVGVFETFEALQAAFYDLRTVSFSR